MEDVRNASSSTSNLTDAELFDMLFLGVFPSGPNGLGNGEDYSNSETHERPFDHGGATLNDPFTWVEVGNGTLNDGNSAESWDTGGNQQMYGDHPQSHPSQDSDLQLIPDQHSPTQNSAAAATLVSNHVCDKWILMTKEAFSEHIRKEHSLKTSNSEVTCGWQDCMRKKRGDTLVRHVMEVHLKIRGAICSRCRAYFKSRNCRELKEHRKEGECRRARILYPENGGKKVQCKYIVCEEIVDPINTVQLV
ncbi:hypothetical protein BJ138DRAFT_1167377 [Hygrophoropsis aurantiaca]|uniref:Uncharacterized protein n=1 Tax=Hygrophoropsis aurantiaca TaxID=72124 RepID=A0ACB7ZS78_9AGAM|nr:hypothetical protein BJ138DRAFT_1167377 [Hygrophoropsis aurantiaca]